ncbi:ankyrin repeat protein [Xylariaceae sp. FL0016]|nr:ankyrin repeat protein [Xylariaceae sp. FL0016]
MAAGHLPTLPAAHDELVDYLAKKLDTPVEKVMKPYREFEAQLRELYAQDRKNPILNDPYLNVLPLFAHEPTVIPTRARNLEAESQEVKDHYIMPLPDDKRRPNGSPATVVNLKEFRHNFNVFSESSLSDMNWSNVVAAGSSVVNCLLPVPKEYKQSKRSLRQYYHEKFCPASDVDLFLYGLDEKQAIEKIKEIETRIRDAILSEVTVVRTKNAITICSQYPTRHVQIVLRVYKSVSEILTGFDIDCSGAAYDGHQVYCTPRALASYITQINPVDLSRRSPSYENRLSKYSHRNFEVYWPELDRSRIDPTIYERSFKRTLGLARLLVLERLPTTNAREQYLKRRREERGRPELDSRFQYRLHGNIKDSHEDEVAEWVDEDEVSNYHTFSIPYGTKFHAKKIEKLCYTKDLLLNAEWNQSKEREVYLHRHPAFFGRVDDIISDCCGSCPKPESQEEIEVAEKESEIYVSGDVSFRIDDPGRQQIGSFNPLTDDDWTEMAYVGNTARLCQAIVDADLEHVEDWLSQEGADPNQRDYTGRTPLHLAVISSTPEIVQCLVDHGVRLVARIADGRTALHLAAARGNVEIVRILLEKSSANEELEEKKQDQRRKARPEASEESNVRERQQASHKSAGNDSDEDMNSDGELVENSSDEDSPQSVTTGSFIKVDKDAENQNEQETIPLDDDQDDPDFYKLDALAWDSKCSAMHLAILGGHCDVVKLLCQEFGADVLLPVKIEDSSYRSTHVAILTLVLALALPVEEAMQMSETLLTLGAAPSQADANGVTAFHRYVRTGTPELIQSLWENDKLGLKTAINHVAVSGSYWNANATSPLVTAIDQGNSILVLKLLEAGAKPEIDFDTWLKGAKVSFEDQLSSYESNQNKYKDTTEQPLLVAIQSAHPISAVKMLEAGANPDTLTKSSFNIIRNEWAARYNRGETALDVVRRLSRQLGKYEGELGNTNIGAPEEPHGTAEFLASFNEGTYQHWVVSKDIKSSIETYECEAREHRENEKKNANAEGLAEKRQAIGNAISQLVEVGRALESRGAKTFKELYPQVEEPPLSPDASDEDKPQEPYKFDFTFKNVRDVTESRKAAYIELFEASWAGNLEKIKSLTLEPFGEDMSEPPLKIAVSDSNGNNPFSLAFLKGHYETAKAVLEIVQAQWAPKEAPKSRFTMRKNDDSNTDEDSDMESTDEPEIYEEIINDQLTIDNIGQISMQVKSDTLASAMLNWWVPTFSRRNEKLSDTDGHRRLLSFAILQGDYEQFRLLVEMSIHFAHKDPDQGDGEGSKFYTFPEDHFIDMIHRGRTNMLADAIKRTGAGIPLEHLVKRSGMAMDIKPRYYQGLTVYGKKRADWAKAGRNLMTRPKGDATPPLLTAAFSGSLESVEWFLGDAPTRHYLEFGKSKIAREDPRLKHLSEAPGGFDRTIMRWLGAQNDFVIHCAVLGPPGDETNRLIAYLIRVCPSSLEAKSDQGFTPLFLAALIGRVQFAKILIDAGADQSVKDKNSNNIIHATLTNSPKADQLRKMLQLLDPDLRFHQFQQRNNLTDGGDTPLHYWLKQANILRYEPFSGTRWELQKESDDNVNMLSLLLEFSEGEELAILNGSGDSVLHSAVVRSLPGHARVLLEHSPQLLQRENTVGRTPGEIAYDMYINWRVGRLEPIETGSNPDRVSNLVKRDPGTFVSHRKETRPRQEATWEVVKGYLAKATDKRRLVSLNEANDVAKRLGEKYTWQRYYQKKTTANGDEAHEEEQEELDKEEDFVTRTYSLAKRDAWRNEEESPKTS